MKFLVCYLSVYLDEVSHYGNLPSKVRKLKKTIVVYLSSSRSMEIRILSSRNGSESRVRVMSVWLKWTDRNRRCIKSIFNAIGWKRSNFRKGYYEDDRFISLCRWRTEVLLEYKSILSWRMDMKELDRIVCHWNLQIKWQISWARGVPERLTFLYIRERISFLKT